MSSEEPSYNSFDSSSPSSYSTTSTQISPPSKDKSKKKWSFSPLAKKPKTDPYVREKLDEISDFQKEILWNQKEINHKQDGNTRRLSFLEKTIVAICGHSPTKDCIHKKSPTYKASNSAEQRYWDMERKIWEDTPTTPEGKCKPRRLFGEGPSSPKHPSWSPINYDAQPYEPNSWDIQEMENKRL